MNKNSFILIFTLGMLLNGTGLSQVSYYYNDNGIAATVTEATDPAQVILSLKNKKMTVADFRERDAEPLFLTITNNTKKDIYISSSSFYPFFLSMPFKLSSFFHTSIDISPAICILLSFIPFVINMEVDINNFKSEESVSRLDWYVEFMTNENIKLYRGQLWVTSLLTPLLTGLIVAPVHRLYLSDYNDYIDQLCKEHILDDKRCVKVGETLKQILPLKLKEWRRLKNQPLRFCFYTRGKVKDESHTIHLYGDHIID